MWRTEDDRPPPFREKLVSESVRSTGARGPDFLEIGMRRFVITLMGLGTLAAGPVRVSRTPVVVEGVIFDSLGHAPLGNAIVQLVPADASSHAAQTTNADSAGHYRFDQVEGGRYRMGFFHPMLDSLGVEAALREVLVEGDRGVRVDLATPSPARLRAAICGAATAKDSSGIVIGFVRGALDGAAAAGVQVTAQWVEFTLRRGGYDRSTPTFTATTGDNGWFAVCKAPSGGTMMLQASRGADSTDLLELRVPADGFLRRDLYLGAARVVAVSTPSVSRDSTTPPPAMTMHTGEGRLTGIVVTKADGRPIASAQVRIADGPAAVVNERGEWSLAGAPLGTRLLEVRALGFYPERRPVAVTTDPARVRIELATLKSVLDTVRVTALRTSSRNLQEFEFRKRAFAGRYVTPKEIERLNPVTTTNILRGMNGVYADGDPRSPDRDSIMMRGMFASPGGSYACAPSIYVDGWKLPEASKTELDAAIDPKDIGGMEIYMAGTAPVQFQEGIIAKNAGCGVILVWRK